METEQAFAKVNLALAVTGRRDDGYHLIDSLVVFTGFGDAVSVQEAERDGFTATGEYAAALANTGYGPRYSPESDTESGPEPANDDLAGNLVVRARDALRASLKGRGISAPPVALHLIKRLPVASGIGGGSSDAAATLRALCRHWGHMPEAGELVTIAASLGADIPMCLVSRPLRARGIGEEIMPVANIPSFWMVLANAGIPVSTPAIFSRLAKRHNTPFALPGSFDDARAIADWVRGARNDLLEPAMELAPEIGDCLKALRKTPALAAGMSGSGATCFAIYADESVAHQAENSLRVAHPAWFVVATQTLPSSD